MSNRILHIAVRSHSTVPAGAEVRVTVVPERLTPATEVRGRLMGPTCRYAGTVEVAYHLRPFLAPAPVPGPGPAVTLRAIIPEASLWEPESPFLYQGPVELWQDGRRCQVVPVRHGLRSLGLGPRGLRVNGRLLPLRGRSVEGPVTEQDLEGWRQAGSNLLLAPVEESALWGLADRLGFLVLGRLGAGEGAVQRAAHLTGHPSCLGWLVGPGEPVPAGLPAGALVGAEVAEGTAPEVAPGAAFAVGPAPLLAQVARPRLALLAVGEGEEDALPQGGGPLLGWVG
jgi:hypothetical protein